MIKNRFYERFSNKCVFYVFEDRVSKLPRAKAKMDISGK